MTTKYECDYCRFESRDLNQMTYHEIHCGGNPKNKNCGICINLERDYFGIETTCKKNMFDIRTKEDCKEFEERNKTKEKV